MNNPAPKRTVRFLSLGDLRTDRRLKNFIDFFHQSGFAVELFFASFKKSSEPNIRIEGIISREIQLTAFRGRKMFLQYDRLLKQALAAAGPCDILFATELFSLKAASQMKRSGRTKQLFYDARELYTELPAVARSPLKKLFWKRWEKKGLRQADLVVVTAPDDADAIKTVHGFLPPHIVIRNFPRNEAWQPNNYLHDYFAIPSAKKIFVYAGGLLQDRGIEQMMKAMTDLQKEAVFVIIGDGALKESLQKECNDLKLGESVFFHPATESEKVVRMLSSADAGINLIVQRSISYQHALPSKVFEYLLAGLPIVSSRLKQVKELLEGHEGIFYADPENQEEIVTACKKALQKGCDQLFRKNLYDDAAKNFTFETEAKVLKQFLSSQHLTPNT